MERPMTGKAGERPASGVKDLLKDHKELYDNDPKGPKTLPSLYDKESDVPVAMESEVLVHDLYVSQILLLHEAEYEHILGV